MRSVIITQSPVAASPVIFARDFEVEGWRHRSTARLGFDTASFSLKADRVDLEELFTNGLGRRVTRYSPDGNFVVWDGQIVEMTLTVPGSQSRISLRDMANRVNVRYTPINTGTNPPTESPETSTSSADDTASQALYGVRQLVFSPPKINRLTSGVADQLRNMILARYALPRRSGQGNDADASPKLMVLCEGYIHTLAWRIYNQTATSGTSNASTVLSNILTAVGQFIQLRNIVTNTTQVQNYFNRDNTALEIIQAIASFGDGTNRWIANVFENRQFNYKQASTAVSLERRIADGKHVFINAQGRPIPNYEIRPDNWLRWTDIHGQSLMTGTLERDYQCSYIEGVEFSDPDSIQIYGSTGDELQVITSRIAGRGDALL